MTVLPELPDLGTKGYVWSTLSPWSLHPMIPSPNVCLPSLWFESNPFWLQAARMISVICNWFLISDFCYLLSVICNWSLTESTPLREGSEHQPCVCVCVCVCAFGVCVCVCVHLGSSQTKDRTVVPCIGRQIFNQWTTREEQNNSFLSEAMKAQRG